MEYIVVGCGRVGSELAYRLFQKGHRVAVIDTKPESFLNLNPDFRGRTIEGEAMNHTVLRRAGIETAQGLAAVTSSDTLNIVIAHVAREVYHIPNVVVRNYNHEYRPLFEAFNQQVISSSSWGAQRIEELLYHQEMRTVFSAGNGEVEIYEFTLPRAWEGRRARELLPEGVRLSAMTRAGKAILPDDEAALQHGDIVLVSATLEGITGLRRELEEAQEV